MAKAKKTSVEVKPLFNVTIQHTIPWAPVVTRAEFLNILDIFFYWFETGDFKFKKSKNVWHNGVLQAFMNMSIRIRALAEIYQADGKNLPSSDFASSALDLIVAYYDGALGKKSELDKILESEKLGRPFITNAMDVIIELMRSLDLSLAEHGDLYDELTSGNDCEFILSTLRLSDNGNTKENKKKLAEMQSYLYSIVHSHLNTFLTLIETSLPDLRADTIKAQREAEAKELAIKIQSHKAFLEKNGYDVLVKTAK